MLNQNTANALQNPAAAGVLAPADAQLLVPAAGLYHDLTQLVRLCLDRPFDPKTASPGLKGLLTRATTRHSFKELEDHLTATVSSVRECYERLVR